MNTMTSLNFSQEIAAQRRDLMMDVAARHRLVTAARRPRVRRWFKSANVDNAVNAASLAGPESGNGRVLRLAAAVAANGSATPAPNQPTPSTAISELEHASARVA